MDQLFLLEVVADTIYFQSTNLVPQRKQIVIVATFGNFATLEIRTDGLGALDNKEIDAKRRDIPVNFGKSYLFSSKPIDLLNALEKCPLEIVLSTKLSPTPIGKAVIKWEREFIDMVKSSQESAGYITPAYVGDYYELIDATNTVIGEMEMFVRLSCFGKSITTHMQMVKPTSNRDGSPGTGATKFLFKSANAATTFECQTFGMGTSSEFIPVGPIFQGTDIVDTKNAIPMKPMQYTRSTETIAGESRMPSAFVFEQPLKNFNPLDLKYLAEVLTASASGRESLIVRPEECDFINLDDLIKADREYAAGKRKSENSFDESSLSSSASGNSGKPKRVADMKLEDLTVEQIEKMLCKSKDCPAAKKFKEYGIGPLATGKGLGTLYDREVPVPTTYGMSHTMGNIDKYGPYGVYSRPKTLDQKFLPRHQSSLLETSSGGDKADSECCSNDSAQCCTKLKGGSSVLILRLRGGAPVVKDSTEQSPMAKCRSLMEDFDRVVNAYKLALGPCGQATCPFAQNLVIETCRKQCPVGQESSPSSVATSSPEPSLVGSCPGPEENMSACGNSTCPYVRVDDNPVAKEFAKSQVKSACGEPSCAYTRKKLGMDSDEDNNPKFHTLPKNCGSSKCPYSAKEELPPIHWDCPEPLPAGLCRNPMCPITQKNHIINCMFTAPKPPCGGGPHVCPYVPPPPCDFRGCPFAPPEPCPKFCPYAKDPCPRECPYAVKQPAENCIDPGCPFNQAAAGDSNECGGAEKKGSQGGSICSNEDCEYAQHDKELLPCDGTTCKAKGGSLECDECSIAGNCACAGKHSRPTNPPNTPNSAAHTTAGSTGGTDSLSKHKGNGNSANGKPAQTPASAPTPSAPAPASIEPIIEKTEVVPEVTVATPKPAVPDSAATTTTAITTAPTTANSGRKPKKKHRHSQFVYGEGDTYPGIHIGHKECNIPTLNVPKNMGWLWNSKKIVGRLKPRRGWRPGAITKTIAARIEEHRIKMGIKPIPAQQKPSKRRIRKKKDGTYGGYESESEEDIPTKPTLQIKKKDGCYLITMNPLKDPYSLEENENPYIDCTPMQFKIAKNKDETVEKSCYCGEEGGEELNSSDSELDIEFTPPAGIIHPERLKRKKNIVHITTQYDTTDFTPPAPPKLKLEKKESGGKKGKGKGGKGGKGKKKK